MEKTISNANQLNQKNFWHKNGHMILIYAFTLLIMAIATALDKDFLTARNLNNLVLSAFPLMIVAFAQMMVLLIAGLDLSLGSIVGLTNVVCVSLMRPSDPAGWAFAVVAALITGLSCGAVNGLLVTKARLTPVIATIATTSLFGGLAMYIQPIPGGKVHGLFSKFLLGKMDFPTHILLLLLLLLIVRVLTNQSPFGKKMRAIGGNEYASYVTGIPVDRVKIITYSLAGLLAGIAGVFLTAQMRCGDASVGNSYTMNAITVAVVGGTMLSGSVGDALGIVAGAFMIMVINNILNLVGVSSFYQYVFQGLILIVALAISALRTREKS